MIDARRAKVGERYEFWITAEVGKFTGKVTEMINGRPWIKVEAARNWPILKDGDYLLLRKLESDQG